MVCFSSSSASLEVDFYDIIAVATPHIYYLHTITDSEA